MLNHRHKGLLLLASSLLFTGLAQPVFAATITKPVVKPTVKLQPQKNYVAVSFSKFTAETSHQSLQLLFNERVWHGG